MSKETAALVNVRRTLLLALPVIAATIAGFTFFLIQAIAEHQPDLILSSILTLIPGASVSFTLVRVLWLRAQN